MIADDGFERSLLNDGLLSEEEVRELLKDVPDSRDPEGHGAPRILFLSRRGADAALLRDRLEAAGAVLDMVRNPFAALDRMRVAPPEAVVTDIDLWADDGALLFDRLRRASKAVPVLFISSSRGDREVVEARLRRAGAWEVLFRPIEAGEAESAARRLVETARDQAGGSTGNAPAAALSPSQLSDGEERSALLDLNEVGAGSSSAGGRKTAVEDGELIWLRFHFHLNRTVRSAASREDCVVGVLDAVRQYLGPRAAGVFYETEGRALARLEAAPGAGLPALESLCASAGAGRIEGGTDLALAFRGPASSGRLVIAGLLPAIRAAASSYVEDVRTLVEEGLAR